MHTRLSTAMGRSKIAQSDKTTKKRQKPIVKTRPSTMKRDAARRNPSAHALPADKQSLAYPRWIDIQDERMEPSAFAKKVAEHYAAKGFSMTAVNVQSLIAEAEDSRSYSIRSNAPHTLHVLRYMATQLECMFGRKSCKWLSELQRIHDDC
jgi:hypothetical protein